MLIGAACVLATLLNPHGPAILWYPAQYFFEGQSDRALVSEWQRPSLLVFTHWPIFLADAILVLALLLRTRPRPFLCIVTIVFVALSLQALRNAPFVALLLLPAAGPAIAARWPRWSRAADARTTISMLAAGITVAIVLASVALLPVRLGGAISLRNVAHEGYPQAGAAYVREYGTGGRLYNEYAWGGYLVHALYPEKRVFIDGRADFYGNRILNDYAAIGRMEPGWEELLRQYGIDVVLLRKESRLARRLRSDSSWQEVFTGPVEAVLVRVPDAGERR